MVSQQCRKVRIDPGEGNAKYLTRGAENAETIGFLPRERRGPLPSPGPTDRTVRVVLSLADSLDAQLSVLEAFLIAQGEIIIRQRVFLEAQAKRIDRLDALEDRIKSRSNGRRKKMGNGSKV
jgi:hypothetical protein